MGLFDFFREFRLSSALEDLGAGNDTQTRIRGAVAIERLGPWVARSKSFQSKVPRALIAGIQKREPRDLRLRCYMAATAIESRELSILFGDFSDEDPVVRAAIATGLGRLGEGAARALLNLVKAWGQETHELASMQMWQAIKTIAPHFPPSGEERWPDTLDDEVVERCLEAVASISERQRRSLDQFEVDLLAEQLQKLGPLGVLPLTRLALAYDDPAVTLEYDWILKRLRSLEARPKDLDKLLQWVDESSGTTMEGGHRSESKRRRAGQAAAEILTRTGVEAVPQLLAFLEDERPSSPRARSTAEAALVEILKASAPGSAEIRRTVDSLPELAGLSEAASAEIERLATHSG